MPVIRAAGGGAGGRGARLGRQRQRERRADADGALDGDGAAEQVREAARDGQAEAGAGVAARRAAVDLTELLEDELLVLAADADAGVA